MRRRLVALIRKEFSQLFRDVPMLLILVWAFTGAVYTGGHGISTELSRYPIVVLDLSQSSASRELLSRFRAAYFKLVGHVWSDHEVVARLDRGEASLAVVIPPDFARRVHERAARFQVISDGSQSMTATLATIHIASIAQGYSVERLRSRSLGDVHIAQIEARPRVECNANANLVQKWFSSLLEVFNQATMISMLLAAAAMVREREHGTVEHLPVSPLRSIELFAAKLVPVVTLVPLAVVGSVLGIVQGSFETPIRGSLALFYVVTVVYVFAIASLGIAVVARTLGQAMMMLLLILYPMNLLSGAFSPPESQGAFMRTVGVLSPVRHYVDFGYQALFKGNGMVYVWREVGAILTLGVVLFSLSVRRFSRLVR